MDDVDKDLANFLEYLKTGRPTDEFTSELDDSVRYARTNKEWKEEYSAMNMQKRVWEQNEHFRTVLLYVKEGFIPIERASKDLGIPTSEIKKMLSEEQQKKPELV